MYRQQLTTFLNFTLQYYLLGEGGKYHNVFVYPCMDGAYITTTKGSDIEKIIVRIYSELAKIFVKESNPNHWFLIRGSIAYGEIIHGHLVPFSASKVFETDLNYKSHILLGSAMIEAYKEEANASPFGVSLGQSLIKYKNKYKPFQEDWKWFESKLLKVDSKLITMLKERLCKYFQHAKASNLYPKIETHQSLANEYFTEHKPHNIIN